MKKSFYIFIGVALISSFAIKAFASLLRVNQSVAGVSSQGLVGWWTFDGGNMISNVADSSGQGNTGSLQFGTLGNVSTSSMVTAGKLGQGLKFDGLDDYVKGPDIQTPSNAITITAWIYPTAISGIYGDIATRVNGYGLRLVDTGRISLALRTTDRAWTYAVQTANNVIKVNKWQFIAVTWAAGSLAHGYYNAVEVNNGGASIFTGNISYSGTAGTVVTAIGAGYSSSAATNLFPGSIDDVRIYNRALSASEITQLYNSGLARINQSVPAVASAGLVGWWTFDGANMINNVVDRSGQNNTGYLKFGTLGNVSTSSMVTVGKLGQGLKFDGRDDYVNVPNTSRLAVELSAFSVSAWVKVSNQPASGNRTYFLFKGNTGRTDGYSFLYNNLSGTKQINLVKGGVTLQGVNQTLANNTWYHLMAVQNFSGGHPSSVTYYVNGVNIGSYVDSSDYSNSDTEAVSLGAGNVSASVSFPLNGSLDDVRIYNRALSAGEIKQLYNNGLLRIKK